MPAVIQIHIEQEEIKKRRALLKAWSQFQNDRPPVHVFVDSPFYCKLAGVDIRDIYESAEAMVRAQLCGYKAILEAVDCDTTAPNVGIDFGSPLTASTYGCKLIEQPGSVPGHEAWFKSEDDLPALEKIDSFTNGLQSKALEYYHQIRKMARNYAICFDGGEPIYPLQAVEIPTASEGPFSILCMIAGLDRVAMWCYDRPNLVKQMMKIVTEKEIERIRKSFGLMGKPARDIKLADDFSPYLSVEMYEEFVLPYQQRLRDAFGSRCFFHSCIPDSKLLKYWVQDLNIRLFNGFKPVNGLDNLKRDYEPVAELMAGRVLLEPDLDGANIMVATEKKLEEATRTFLSLFDGFNGVKLCFTLSGGHRPDDLKKLNIIKKTVLVHSPQQHCCEGRTCLLPETGRFK